MKQTLFVLSLATMFFSCGNDKKTEDSSTEAPITEAVESEPTPNMGIGEITQVTLNDPLDQEMVKRGKGIYEMKCAACHKLTGARVVGPSWEGITQRRTPEWIMNMITNTDAMLNSDPDAQKMLEECLTRMPNQNLSVGEARDVLEFMYSLDQKTGK